MEGGRAETLKQDLLHQLCGVEDTRSGGRGGGRHGSAKASLSSSLDVGAQELGLRICAWRLLVVFPSAPGIHSVAAAVAQLLKLAAFLPMCSVSAELVALASEQSAATVCGGKSSNASGKSVLM